MSSVAALGGWSFCGALLCCVHAVQDGGLFAFVVVVKRLRCDLMGSLACLRYCPITHRGLSICGLVLEMWMHVAIYMTEVLRHVLSLNQAL